MQDREKKKHIKSFFGLSFSCVIFMSECHSDDRYTKFVLSNLISTLCFDGQIHLRSPVTNLLCAPHWEWPWCCICECSGSTRLASGHLHLLHHFSACQQSKTPTGWTRLRVTSCLAPAKFMHSQILNSVRRPIFRQAALVKGSGEKKMELKPKVFLQL